MDKDAEDISNGWRELGEVARVGRRTGENDVWEGPHVVEEIVDVICEQFPRTVGVAVVDDSLVAYLAAKKVDCLGG